MNRRQVARIFIGILVLALLFSVAGQALAVGPDDPTDPNGAARKIVVFKDSVTGEGAQEQIVSQAGAAKIKHLRIVNATVVLATPASERALRARPEVLRIDDDAIAHALVKPEGKPTKPAPTPPPETLPWGVDRIDADLVWDADGDLTVDTGANAGSLVKVAVLDTGIDLDHPDLKDNIKGGYNAINSAKSGDDDNGHGTHVAGIIAGVDNAIGVLGVAPKAHLYAVKVLSRTGSGYFSDIIEGLQWCMENDIQVVNMSLGSPSNVQSFKDAITATYNAGITLVAAAGNSGPGDNTVEYPARYPEVIAVSATDSSDNIAGWSSRGPEVDLAAPGVSINSTYKGGGYKVLSGTSMASPHVAGVAALVIASGVSDGNGDDRINDEVRSILESTAENLSELNVPNSLYGYGLVDAYAAVSGN